MIKGVIFDVDGVLLNSMPVWENLGELYLDHLGIEAEKNLGETLFEMSLEEAADYLISHYNLEKTVEEVVQGLNKEVEDYYAKRVPLKEGVRQYLEEFRERKIPMVIATTGDRKNAEAALSRLKVLPYFQGVFTASEIGSGKDQPDIYFAALLQLDTEPEQTWVFEDTYQALRTAKHAGFKTVAVYDKANDKNLAQIWNTAVFRNHMFRRTRVSAAENPPCAAIGRTAAPYPQTRRASQEAADAASPPAGHAVRTTTMCSRFHGHTRKKCGQSAPEPRLPAADVPVLFVRPE